MAAFETPSYIVQTHTHVLPVAVGRRVGANPCLFPFFASMIFSGFVGQNQKIVEYGSQVGLVDPKVKVTILLMIMIRGARERGGRKLSIY